MPPDKIITSSFLLDNLHCPSCVAMIQTVLQQSFGDQILWTSPNLVTSVVTVEHKDSPSVSIASIQTALENAGFEVCGVDTTANRSHTSPQETATHDVAGTGYAGQVPTMGWSSLWQTKRSSQNHDAIMAVHLENCEACRLSSPNRQNSIVDMEKAPRDSVIEDHPLSAVVTGDENSPIWRATLSIGGMTCASCVNTIVDEIQKLSWVSKVTVNLVTNSATVDFIGDNRAEDVVEAIEDLGYDAVVDNVVDINEPTRNEPTDHKDVQIKVDGMFCGRCPDRIARTLASFGPDRLTILDQPTPAQPLLRLRYVPDAPFFTIRSILRAISASDPSLRPSIHHPPTLEERSRAVRAKHQRALLGRLALTFIMAVPTFVFGIVYMSLVPESNHMKHYLMKPWTSGLSRLDIILCLLATPVWLFAADVFHIRAIREIRTMWRPGSRTPLVTRFFKFGSMDMLMSLGSTIAYISSVAQMIAAAANDKPKVPEGLFYFDSVVFLTLFLLAGRLIEAYSKSKTGNAVEMLVKLRPNTAILIEKDKASGQTTTTTIPLDQIERGDMIRVPHGGSPAADGVILTGSSSFDESSLTGESRPVPKTEGDKVFVGTINKSSVVTVLVTETTGKSMLDQIVEVVREGQSKRAPMERAADALTSYFVPVITLIAIITWIVWLGLGYSGKINDEHLDTQGGWAAFALQFAIAVFVVACPCGIGLAAPTAIFVGGGLAAKHGVLVKGGGEAFEKAHKVDCIVFDKTGTITEGGEPKVTDSFFLHEGSNEVPDRTSLLSSMKMVEENSSHPLAKAVVAFCGTTASSDEVEDVEELPGRGIRATVNQNGKAAFEVAIGNERLLDSLSVGVPSEVASLTQTWKQEAKSIVLVSTKLANGANWVLAAALSVSDPIRKNARAVLEELQSSGIQVWMLSGDNVTTAQAVAEKVGIPANNVLAEVLPADKAAKVKYLQSTAGSGKGRAIVAMVGDGINDSPALTAADVAIAIGSGSDVSISSADFVLATSELKAVLTLLELSRIVFRRIQFNFGWAVIYNMVAIPFAAGCLYPIITSSGAHVRLDPVWASLAMALSSISVVLSSLSLRSNLPLVGFRAKKL